MEATMRMDRRLGELHQKILRMGSLVEEAILKSIEALRDADEQLAATVIAGDIEIDRLHFEIEDRGTQIFALEQPVATDLREVITAMRIATELERIGDHARHVARAVRPIPEEVLGAALPRIEAMARIGASMVHDSLTAYVHADTSAAREVAQRDDDIDESYRRVNRDLVELMKSESSLIEPGLELLFLNRFMERLGDHVTNICEWIIFARDGVHVELNG